MSDKRRGLGRGLGALIPAGPANASVASLVTERERTQRPVDVFFPGPATPLARTSAFGRGVGPGSGPQRAGAADGDAQPSNLQSRDTSPGGDDVVCPQPDVAGSPAASDELLPVPGVEFAELAVDAITPNPRQPRSVFDEDELAELASSVREVGVLQPVVVRRLPDDAGRFELVMGERRWRASQQAGLSTVPAIIRATADDDLLRDALLENLHRSQLNALEEAAAYAQLLEDFGCTHDDLARRIGRSRPQISNTIRLLKLPALVQRRVAAGVLSAGHARALLGLDDGAAIERLAQRVVAEGLSVRATEEVVALGGGPEPAARRASAVRAAPSPHLAEVAARLSDRFETRVSIAMGRRTGRLTVEFASVDDLERILGVLEPRPDGAPTA